MACLSKQTGFRVIISNWHIRNVHTRQLLYLSEYPCAHSLTSQTTLCRQSELTHGDNCFCYILVSPLSVAQEQAHMPMYHPTPSQARLATQLTEEEQIRIAQRIGLIQHLPKGVYDGGQDGSEKKIRE